VHFFAESPALGKTIFAECLTLPRAALGKEPLCQVPDKRHSAKHLVLGIEPVSGSGRREKWKNYSKFLHFSMPVKDIP
jgi:hypothetical protein